MLRFGVPGALWLSLALVPVFIFYFLRIRFRKQPVSSTYIWERIGKTQGGASRLRWRTILLLCIQIAAVLAVVGAAARPAWLSHRFTGIGTLYLIDASASMTATDVQPNRLTRACSIVKKEIERMPSGYYGAIFACSSDAFVLGEPTDDRRRLISQLKDIRSGGTAFDEYAVSQSVQEWLSRQERPWQICLVTDGGLSMNGRRLAALAVGRRRVIHVGTHVGNIGIVGFRLLKGQSAKVSVFNGWPTARKIRVELQRDGRQLVSADLLATPGIHGYTIPWKLSNPPRYGLYQAELHGNRDYLAVDDRFYLAVNPPRRYRVLLVGEANPFLRAVLEDAQIDLVHMKEFPKKFEGANWDLTIANRISVPSNYHGNLITFGVVPSGLPVRPGKVLDGNLESKDSTHPLLRFVNWRNVPVVNGRELVTKEGVQTLATVQGRPVLSAWEHEGRHVIVCGTDLDNSELGLSGAFPVFLQNVLQWCVPQGNNPLAYTLTAGHPVIFTEAPTWKLEETPADFSVERKGNSLRIQGLRPGIARWIQGKYRGAIGVNLPMSEHNIETSEVYHGKSGAFIHGQRLIKRYDLASALLVLLLLCFVLEWIIWRGDWSFFRKE